MKRKVVKYTLLVGLVVALCATTLYATRNDAGLGRNMEIMINLMRAIATEYVDEVETAYFTNEPRKYQIPQS